MGGGWGGSSVSIPDPGRLVLQPACGRLRSRWRGSPIVGLSVTEKLIVRLMKTLRESSSARVFRLGFKRAPQTGS